jgi:hypothetical protein
MWTIQKKNTWPDVKCHVDQYGIDAWSNGKSKPEPMRGRHVGHSKRTRGHTLSATWANTGLTRGPMENETLPNEMTTRGSVENGHVSVR